MLCRSKSEEASSSKGSEQVLPRIVVFGGNGFVGSKVCQYAVEMGVGVTSVSRSGRPRFLDNAGWADSVEWVRSDGTKSNGQWRETMDGACGVVSTLGAFGSNEFMYKMLSLIHI